MTSDPPELGKGLFGYRRSAVNQILTDRDTMLRQAEGRVRAAESKVADLEGELQAIRTRNARMDEQLERLRTQLDAISRRSEGRGSEAGDVAWDEGSDLDLEEYGEEPSPGLEPFEEAPGLAYGYEMQTDEPASEPTGEPEAYRAEAYRAVVSDPDQEAGPDSYMETAPEYAEPELSYAAEPTPEVVEGAESSEPFVYGQNGYSYGEGPVTEPEEPATDLEAFSYAAEGDVAFVREEPSDLPEDSADEVEAYREEQPAFDVPAVEPSAPEPSAPEPFAPEPSAFGPETYEAPRMEHAAAESTQLDQAPRSQEYPPVAAAPPPVSTEASDMTSRLITQEIAGVLNAAEESAARILERARAESEQQSAQSHRLWEEVQAEVARLASWREGVDPVIRTVLTKVEGIRARIEDMPERIREALAPMADSISGIDADLAELAEACSPPLLLTPSKLEPEGERVPEWESEDGASRAI
jgi:hypothetical protein